MRASLSEEFLSKIEEPEHEALHLLTGKNGLFEVQNLFGSHVWLRDEIWPRFRKDYTEPRANTVYMIWDHKANTFF